MENKTQDLSTPHTNQNGEDKKGYKPRYISRRERRASYRTVYNNDRKPKGSGFIQMGIAWDGKAVFFPKRKKLKGWEKTLKHK